MVLGLGLGTVILTKGLILGAILTAQGNNRRSSRRSGRRYVYGSGRRYQKREALVPGSSTDHGIMSTLHNEIEASFMSGAWVEEVASMDGDDCIKRMVCEIAAANTSRPLSLVEADLFEAFAMDQPGPMWAPKAVFDRAAFAGGFSPMGVEQCRQDYRRCKVPVNTILRLVSAEQNLFTNLQQEMDRKNSPITNDQEI